MIYKKCRGYFIPRYRTKKETIYSPSGIKYPNMISEDGPFKKLLSYEELESVCMDCLKEECRVIDEEI